MSTSLGFGRFANLPLYKVPSDYLSWALRTTTDEKVAQVCAAELAERKKNGQPSKNGNRKVHDAASAWLEGKTKRKKRSAEERKQAKKRRPTREELKAWATRGFDGDGRRVVMEGPLAGFPLIRCKTKSLINTLSGLLSEEALQELLEDRRQLICAAIEESHAKETKKSLLR